MKPLTPIRVMSLLALTAAFACGGSDDPEDVPERTLAVAASPATAELVQGTSATVSVALTRGNLNEVNVELTVNGAPQGVTAAFNPASTTADDSTLTITAAANATLGAATLTLTAAAPGGPSATATVAITVAQPAPITITGRATNAFEVPRSGVTIHVWSSGASGPNDVITGADGTFTLANVRTPYDIVYTLPSAGPRVMLGLTSATPLIADMHDDGYGPTPTTLAGDLTGVVAGAKGIVTMETSNGGAWDQVDVNATSYSMSFTPPATGSAVATTIKVLHYTTGANGVPTAYHHFATRAAVLGLPVPGDQDFALSGTVATHSVDMSGLTSTGARVPAIGLFWTGNRDNALMSVVTPAQDITPVLLPNDTAIPCAAYFIDSGAKGGAVRIEPITASTTAINVQLAGIPGQISPSDGAINVTDALNLNVEAVEGATYYFIIDNPTPQDSINVISATNNVSLARLRTLGVGLAATTAYELDVKIVSPAAADGAFGRSRLLATEMAKTPGAGYRQSLTTFATP